MRVGEKPQDELDIVPQIVDYVHKPVLAVSSIVHQGHKVIFAEEDSHILVSSGSQMPVRYQNGTYDFDTFVKNPGFNRHGGR